MLSICKHRSWLSQKAARAGLRHLVSSGYQYCKYRRVGNVFSAHIGSQKITATTVPPQRGQMNRCPPYFWFGVFFRSSYGIQTCPLRLPLNQPDPNTTSQRRPSAPFSAALGAASNFATTVSFSLMLLRSRSFALSASPSKYICVKRRLLLPRTSK